MRRPLLAALVAITTLFLTQAGGRSLAQDKVSFTKQVAPILVKNCLACHGAQDAKGGFRLHTFEALSKPGDSGTAPVAATKPMESEIFKLINEMDKDVRMPKDADRLPDDQIALIRRWIEEGAAFDSPDPKATLVSIAPKPPHPMPPEAYRVPAPILALAFRPDGAELAASGYHEITIWNPADGALIRRIKNVAARTLGLSYSPDGTLLAAASGTPGQVGEVKLFNAADGALLKELGTMPDEAMDVKFSPDGKRLAAAGADRSIRVWDVATGQQQLLIEDHADWVMSIAWNADGTKLVSASRDKTAKVFDATKGESLVTFPGHQEVVFGSSFTANGALVITAGRDRRFRVWKPEDAAQQAEIGGWGHEVYKAVVVGNRLFGCSADNTAREFNVETKGQVRVFQGHTDWVYAIGFNDATKRLATGSFDGEIRIWNSEDGMLVKNFKAAPGYTPPAQ